MKKEFHLRNVLENSALILVTATALVKAVDVAALGSQPLIPANRFWWMVDEDSENPNCYNAIIISTHDVHRGESVTLYARSFSGDTTLEKKQVSLSGRSIAVDTIEAFCFPLPVSSPRGIIFSVDNGEASGAPSTFFLP